MSHEAQELQQLYQKDEYQALTQGVVSRRVLEQMHRMDPEKINFDLVAAVVKHIHTQVDPPQKDRSPGAILVFVPGFGEIKKCVAALTEDSQDSYSQHSGKGKGKGSSATSVSGLWVLPLHSMISMVEQRKVFQRPARGLRKVVVTTNIA